MVELAVDAGLEPELLAQVVFVDSLEGSLVEVVSGGGGLDTEFVGSSGQPKVQVHVFWLGESVVGTGGDGNFAVSVLPGQESAVVSDGEVLELNSSVGGDSPWSLGEDSGLVVVDIVFGLGDSSVDLDVALGVDVSDGWDRGGESGGAPKSEVWVDGSSEDGDAWEIELELESLGLELGSEGSLGLVAEVLESGVVGDVVGDGAFLVGGLDGVLELEGSIVDLHLGGEFHGVVEEEVVSGKGAELGSWGVGDFFTE